jgi:hypothetical protein
MRALDLSPRSLILGFIAAAIAVVIFHQGMILVLKLTNLLPTATPWNFRSFGPLGVPTLVNQMFWGGLWGVAFAALFRMIPGGSSLIKGLIWGLLGPALLGNWVLVPLFKGGALFAGFDVQRMVITVLIGAAFGIGLGLIYGLARRA